MFRGKRPMNSATVASHQLGAFASGMCDVLFAFAVVLERRGLLSRADIADTLTEVQAQIAAQEGSQPGRGVVVELMRQAFALPIAGDQARARLRVIEGARDA
jgi:hypothetical protein